MNQLFSQRHLIHRIAHNHGALCVVSEHAADLGNRSDRRGDFLKLLHRGGVGQVEDLHDIILIIAPLGHVILGHEDGVRGERLPERMRQSREIIESLIRGGIAQINIKIAGRRRVLRIENHVHPGQFPYRVV